MSFNLRNGQKDDGMNSWQYRCEACAAAVMDLRPDVVGFQENTLPQDTFLAAALSAYDHVAIGREAGNLVTETNALYYLRDRFELVRTSTFWLSESPNVCSKGWDGKYPRVATYVLLRDRQTLEHYLVVNTHLDHKGATARTESMRLISDTINALCAQNPNMPTVLMGDLNVEPLDPALIPVRQHMLSAQEVLKCEDKTFHSWGRAERGGKIIDFLFFKHTFPTSFRVIKEGYGVPFLSDHYPIIATFLEANDAKAVQKTHQELAKLETRTSDWNSFDRYAAQNDSIRQLSSTNKHYQTSVIFYGNSIAQNWFRQHPDFFTSHGYLCRGIGGQTSSHLLARFREDVLDLKPKTVVLMVGANDLAQNNGIISEKHIMDNIASMCELAKMHKVKMVLCSVLPARRFRWNRMVGDAPERILSLNTAIKAYADANHIQYIDYYSVMVDKDGGMKKGLHKDEVHPTNAGYDIMESVVLKVLK